MIAYKAIIKKTESYVVIKKLAKNEANKVCFLQEIHALSILDHPNITKVIEYFQTKFHYVIIYGYFNGKPILQFLQENPQMRVISFLKSITQKLLNIIAYIHE